MVRHNTFKHIWPPFWVRSWHVDCQLFATRSDGTNLCTSPMARRSPRKLGFVLVRSLTKLAASLSTTASTESRSTHSPLLWFAIQMELNNDFSVHYDSLRLLTSHPESSECVYSIECSPANPQIFDGMRRSDDPSGFPNYNDNSQRRTSFSVYPAQSGSQVKLKMSCEWSRDCSPVVHL
jgi:hypothetical protein